MCVRCGTGRIAWCTSPDNHASEDLRRRARRKARVVDEVKRRVTAYKGGTTGHLPALTLSQWESLLGLPEIAAEAGPWPDRPEPDHCHSYCVWAGRWGASGIMPPGHFWYWRTADRTSGYLAHEMEGPE